ncbi:Heavy-metal-associated domain-containing protein [[Eubacterium] yurii]|jgi:hypothetical protein|nr:MAG: heavy metal transporter [Lachnospiraceae bacterium]SKC42469.1 Heavy-metal-associated domain-containing protein [[Eubacterium] yurii]
MKKKLKMNNLDCANCAMKMQEAISKLDGVNDVQINFMFQKMTIDADDERFDEIIKLAESECKKFEKNVSILY